MRRICSLPVALSLAGPLAGCFNPDTTPGGGGESSSGTEGPTTGMQPTTTVGDPTTATTADTSTGPMAAIESLRLEPANQVLQIDLDTPGSVEYTVIGVLDDGTEMDVTADVEGFTVSNADVGAMNGSTFEVPAQDAAFFASTIVTATIGDVSGRAQLTVAAYRQSGPQQDFFFLLPFVDPAGPQDAPLEFSTDVKALDVFINMDTTGSMGGPITNLQTTIVTTVIPTIEAQIADTNFGAGVFEDFPVVPFGEPVCNYFAPTDPDQPFTLLAEMTDASLDVQAAVDAMTLMPGVPIGCGNNTPEAHFESLYQIATGEGIAGPDPIAVAANTNGIGGVAFREGALPVIVSITDAISNENDASNACLGMPGYEGYASDPVVSTVAHSGEQAIAALTDICARVVTVVISDFSEMCGPLSDAQLLAAETGALIPPEAWDLAEGGRPAACAAEQCCTGIASAGLAPDANGLCPLVYRAEFDGTGLDAGLIDGVQNLAAYATFDATTQVTGTNEDSEGLPMPPGTSTVDFILSVTPLEFGDVPLPGADDPVLTEDAFLGVIPDTPITFTVEAFNSFLPQAQQPRLFTAEITVLADGCSDLDTRQVFILVPPEDIEG